MKKVLIVLGFSALFVGAMALFAFVTMSLWNWLIPVIFGLPLISFWQAVGLLILAKILFGGFGRGGRGGRRHWRGRMRRRWMNMSPEQRAEYKESFKYGYCAPGSEQQTEEAI